MPRSRSRRDMNFLQAILDTEGFGESEHPGSDSTLNTTSSVGSNPRNNPRANPRGADPLDLALQQKHRELQLLLWQQHMERQVLMQRQVLQQQVVMHRASYQHRRGKRGRQQRGPVNIPLGSIPPPAQPYYPVVATRVPTLVQNPQTKVESSTQTVEMEKLALKDKDNKTEGKRRRESSKSRREQDEDRQKELQRISKRDKETSSKHKNKEKKSSEDNNKAQQNEGKKTKKSAEILREEPRPEGQTEMRSRQADEVQVKETGQRSPRLSEEEKEGRGDSHSERGRRHRYDLGTSKDRDSSHRHGNKDHHQGDGNLHDENGNLHRDSSNRKESPHKDDDHHREVKGHLPGNDRDASPRRDASDSECSDSEYSYSSYSDSFSSSDESNITKSGKGSQKSGSDEGGTKRVTFAEQGRREEKNGPVEEDMEKMQAEKAEEPRKAEKKEVKETTGKRRKPRQQSAGRKRTATHPQFTVTSLSSRYLSLVSSLLELKLNPHCPGKERPRTLSSPGKNISEEILKKRAREEKKKRRMERKQEEEEAASPREKQPFQPSDHNLKNSDNPQVQEWLQKKRLAQRQQRREERAKRRLKFQMKMEERDMKIARMIESDEKVDQWMREKRKLLRRKSQKPRKATVQPSVGQQAEAEETTPLSNSNQGQPDLPTLEKQASQLEERLLKDLCTEKGQGDTVQPASGKVGNSTTSPSDGKVAGMDDFARRTVPIRPSRTENSAGAQMTGKVPSRPTTAPPRSNSPTKRRGKRSVHPMSARSGGSTKTSVETPRSVGSGLESARSVGSGSESARDPMRNLSYDQWLVQKRREDQQRKMQVQKEEVDPELQSIIPELARRRVDRATTRKKKLDTGIKHKQRDKDCNKKAAENPDTKPRFVWRLRDDPTLERPLTTRPGSRSPSPGKKSPSPRRPASPLKEPAFYRRQRFSREKMQQFSQSMDSERPEPQGSDCPDLNMHDSKGQSQGSIPTADQSGKGLTEPQGSDCPDLNMHDSKGQSQGSIPTADQSGKGTTEAVLDQSEERTADQSGKGTTEAVLDQSEGRTADQSEKGTAEDVVVIDQSQNKTVDQSESADVKADSQSLSKPGSDQSAPACKKTDQSVNSLFAALGLSDEIEEDIDVESESENEEEKVKMKNDRNPSSSQTFITTAVDTDDGSCG